MRNKKTKLRENIEAVVLALIVALCVKSFIVDHYMVPTGSMVPTIGIGNRLLGLKFIYGAKIPLTTMKLPGIRQPRYGDIIVFKAPHYQDPGLLVSMFNPVVYTLSLGFISIDRQPKFYVKRCIGLPGDKVEIIEKVVCINGRSQKGWWPEYHSDPAVIPAGEDLVNRRDYFGPVQVPADHYFMMGDNRDDSFDSRYWGFVNGKDIYGKAFFRIWPLSRVGLLK